MRFGIKTPPQHAPWSTQLEIWQAADEIEVFESAWNFDHFYPLVGDQNGPCLEGWVTLSALAQATKRLRVGCMVTGIPYRHPAVLANMAATLDVVSGGRLELGLGAGWHEEESEAYGIPLLPMGQRMDRFEEGVEVVRFLLSNEHTDFSGAYYQLTNARCEPKGPQGCPPIVIGGGGEKRTLRIAARFADHWNLPFAGPDAFRAKLAVLERHCQDVGRDVASIRKSVQIAWAADEAPEATAATAAALGEAGVDLVLFSMRNPYRVEALEPLAKALQAIG